MDVVYFLSSVFVSFVQVSAPDTIVGIITDCSNFRVKNFVWVTQRLFFLLRFKNLGVFLAAAGGRPLAK